MAAAVEDFAPREIVSSRGARITVRAVRPEDEDGFHAAFLRLSSESRYTRFMSVVRDLSEATLHHATHPDATREFALVAVAGDQIVAGGRFVAVPETSDCEFAVTVVDDWQGHGLGRALLTALRDAAAVRGYGRMEGYVLSTNLAMRKLGARLGFSDGPMPGDATTRLLVVVLRGTTGVPPAVEKLLPGWWRAYRSGWLRADVLAGLIVAAIVIPKALAYATIAGLPVQAGLYTAMVPMAIYAFFGTSRTLSVSTTTTIAILTGTALTQVVPTGQPELLPTAAATLTLLVGGMLLLAGVLRLGFLANFISEPVLVGFKAGIGIVIVVDQLPKLLGLHLPKEGFLAHALSIVQHLPETSLPTLGVAVATILLLVAIERWWPAIPAPLVAVAAGVGLMAALGLKDQGVSVVGTVPTGLPEFHVPSLQLARDLFADALGIALMSFTETIAAGRAFQRRDEPVPLANRELVATGLATLGGACAGAMPAGGGTSQTAVNTVSGARSPVAGLVTAGMAVACALWLAPIIGAMPNATLAAIVIVYSVGLVEPVEFARILRVRRTEFVWALVAAAGVVLLGTLQGILVAIIVSLAALAYQVTDPPLLVLGRKRGTNVFRQQSAENPDDETFPGAVLVRPEGRIFFANAERLAEKMRPLIEDPSVKTVIVDLRAVPDIEYTALKMLTDAEERLGHLGIALWLVGMNPGVYDVVSRSALGQRLGRAGMHFNLEQALQAYQSARG